MTETGMPKVAYLTGEYPMASHTFILREIAGVRGHGVTVLPCAIREPGAEQLIGPEEEAAHAETFYVLKAAKNPIRLLSAHLALLAQSPRRYLSALRLAVASCAPGARAALWQVFYLAEAGLLAHHLQRQGIGHIHNHFADSSCTVAMLAAEMAGIPFSFTMHGPTEFFAVERWRLDLKVARAKFVACISHFCRSQLMLFSDPAHWEKLKIVRCGIDPARYAGPRIPVPDGRTRLLYVGRLAAVKGLRVLLDALSRLDIPALGLEITFAGDGPDRAALEAEAARRGIPVRFTGYLSQGKVAEELRRTDILVLPSFAEGVPVVLMEAMASGVAVIATRVGGVSELVEDGVSGLLVAPGDAEGLAGAVARLAAAPAERERMGLAGCSTVMSGFRTSVEASKLAQHLLSEKHGGTEVT